MFNLWFVSSHLNNLIYPMVLWLALFSGMVDLILSFCILHYFPPSVVSFFMIGCFFICVFWAFFCLNCLFPPYLFFFFLWDFSLFLSTSLSPPLHLSSSYLLPPSPSPPYECHFSPFLPLLFTHTHASGRGMVQVHEGRIELVPSRQGTACFMCVIENANAHAQEHWLFSQFFCWRICMENIKSHCGRLDPDHFQQQSHESTRGSLRQIILLHPYFEHVCFQGGESLRETQPIFKHFHRGDFSNCTQRGVHCVLQQHS